MYLHQTKKQPYIFISIYIFFSIFLLLLIPYLSEYTLEFTGFLEREVYFYEGVLEDYFFSWIWAIFLGLSIFIFPIPSQHKRVLGFLWCVRCFVTLGIMLFYEYFYQIKPDSGIDGITIYIRGISNTNTIGDFWFIVSQGGTDAIIFLTWIHQQLLPGTYHIVKVSFSMIGMIAIYIFYRAAVQFLQNNNIYLLYILGLYPSILFWSSTLGKDPISLFGIAIYSYGIIYQYKKPKFRYILLIFFGIVITAFIRPWMGIILCLPLFVFIFIQPTKPNNILYSILILIFFFVTMYIVFNILQDKFNLYSQNNAIETINKIQNKSSRGTSSINPEYKLDNASNILVYLPIGVITVLFRPLPGEVLNPFGILAGIENIILIILLWRTIKLKNWKLLKNPVIFWAISLITIWAIVYALGSSYNLGTIVRYRTQILPIILCVFLYLGQTKRTYRYVWAR
jgi:hypothetical protein